MNDRAEGVRVAYPLFQAGGGGSTPTSALQLVVESIDLDTAVGLNRLWHSRFPKLDKRVAAWLAFGAEFDGLWYATAVWSHPVARLLPNDGTWLELRRFAIAPDAPKNTASRLLGVMTRLIRRDRPECVRLMSYQDTESHTGTIYKAAGWERVECKDSQTRWDMPGRKRRAPQSDAVKARWELVLKSQENKEL